MPGVAFRRVYRRTLLALGAVAVLSLPSSILFYYRLNQEKQVSDQLTEIRQEIATVDELLTQLLNLETGVRGYVSTHDERFLDPYWEGKRRIPVALQELEATAHTDGLHGKVNRILFLSSNIIRNPSTPGLEQGKTTMDEIRALLGELKEADERKRDRILSTRNRREKRDLTLVVLSVGGLALLLWLIYQSAVNMKTIFDEVEKLRRAEELALEQEQRLSQAKSAIIQTISHEYRTPLTAILTATELLEIEGLSPDRKKKYLDQVRQGVRRLSGLVNDVLVLFQMESETAPPMRTPIDLRRWFWELTESTGEEDRIGLNIQVQSLLCDEVLLHRVFSNLLNNALKYSSDIVLIRAKEIPNGVEVSIRDKGIGIPHSTRLYQPFERGSNVGTIQGTGLGLSIVKKAVELLGGSITVESQEGEGTQVRVIILSRSSS